jgi:two-component system, LytTR family, sensor kinase
VDLYMGIEKLRLGDRLILDYEIEPAAVTAEVPHLLLQPLFENAVKHGAARLTGACRIAFRAHRENGRLNLCLENDGLVCQPAPNTLRNVRRLTPTGRNLTLVSPHSPDTPRHGVGLTNTVARLSLHYGENFSFQYTDRPQGGVRIDLSFPWRKAER